MNKKEFEKFAQKVRQGNEQLFKNFLLRVYQNGKKSLRGLINSEEEQADIMLDAIYKFRQDYIDDQRLELKSEYINLNGFIYQIAKNMWLAKRRKERVHRKHKEAFEARAIAQAQIIAEEDNSIHETQEKNEVLLRKALEYLKAKCKTLITKHYFEDIGLKDLWKELGYPSYGACRVKHHSCKKNLYKRFMALQSSS